MRIGSTIPAVAALALVSLAAPRVSLAQAAGSALPADAANAEAAEAAAQEPDGIRENGEEEEIREREEWFVTSRGLRTVARPDRLRANAVRELAAARAARGEELRTGGQVWQAVGPTTMTMLSWAMGPVAGRVVSMAVHPTDENVVYIGSASGGLWKTTDGGVNWTSLFDEVGTMSVGAVVLDPANPDVVWAGTGERQNSCTAQGGGQTYFGLGLFRSPDGGQTFEARNGTAPNTLDLSYIQGIAVHPADANTLLVSGEAFCLPDGTRVGGGIFKTTNGGQTWTRVKTGAGSDVYFDPSNPSIAYAAVNAEGIFKSVDGGNTWAAVAGVFASPRMRLAMMATNPQVLYTFTSGGGIFRTLDGNLWTQMAAGACDGQCTYNLTIDIDPVDQDHILIGAIRPYESTNGGVNRTALTTTWGSGQTVHQDIHVVRFSRVNSLRYWIAGDGGIWRTDSAGFNYVNMNANLILTQFYDVAVDPAQPGRIFGGAQDNSSSARLGSDQWNVTVVTGDGFMNAIDPVTLTRVFQTSYPLSGTNFPSVYRSTSSGLPNTFSRLATNGVVAGEPFPWVTPLVAMPDHIFVASHSVYRGISTQPTSTFEWKKISPMIGNGLAASVITLVPPPAKSAGTYVGWGAYVGTSGGSIGRGSYLEAPQPSWTDVTGNYPGGYVSDIAVDPVNRERVYATRGGFNLSRLYVSTTGGTTWTPTGAGLPNLPANAVAVDPTDARRVFVGTDIGVYESGDYGATFLPFMEGMPLGTVVTDLEIDDSPYFLLAGTYGRGALRVDLVPLPAAPPVAAPRSRRR